MIAQKVEAVLDFLCYFIGMKMRKIILLIIQKIFFLGTIFMLLALYILRYFTMRKMGMARYMVYFREKWSGKELGCFSLLQWCVLVILLLLSLALFLIIKRLFFYFGGKVLRERGEKEAFPLFPVSYSIVLILYSLLYFFSLVGSPGREYTASLIVHVLMQIFSVLFLSTYLRKGNRHEK